ncbi:MAG: hypothetical protein O7G83_11980, partial [Proteobacteria bacterium]|nr:hypothetical protein [Pseudomonadota bacterium]
GIEMRSNGGNVIQGNFLGTDVTGTLDQGNGIGGGLFRKPHRVRRRRAIPFERIRRKLRPIRGWQLFT